LARLDGSRFLYGRAAAGASLDSGIGSAAYNTGSNILFMTLSLLLSSLILSGILSLLNFKKLSYSLKVPEHLQVDEVGSAEIALENEKRIFPSMCLAFQVASSAKEKGESLYLKSALSAGKSTALEWVFCPERRGRFHVYMHGVESKFPFGFLLKAIGDTAQQTVLVWPARVDYTFALTGDGQRFSNGTSRRKLGGGNDLLNIREYERGDSQRLIHWKASARMSKLMVRQLANEGQSRFHLYLNPDRELWSDSNFEILCSLCFALSTDLFDADRLDTVKVGSGMPMITRGLHELHSFFDVLAELDPSSQNVALEEHSDLNRRNLITFKPCGKDGIAIYVDGAQVGQA